MSHSTRPTAREWIDQLLMERGYHVEFRWTQDLERLIQSLPEDAREAARAVWESRVGRSAAAILNEQFDRDVAGIKLALDDQDLAILGTTPLVLYPSYDFNAFAGTTPYGDSLLAIHAGLPHTIIAWAHAYVRLFEFGGALDDSVLAEYKELMVYLAHVWEETYHVRPLFRSLSSENLGLSEEMANAALCFVVAHEIGHARLKHTAYTDDQASNHEMEFAADLHGLRVSMWYAFGHSQRYEDSYYMKFMLFGPYLALTLISLFGDADSKTHPSATRRLERVAQQHPRVFHQLVGPAAAPLLEYLDGNVFDMLASNARNLAALCQELGPTLRANLREASRPPHSSFRRT